MTTTCHPTPEGYFVTGEHLDGCTDAACLACWPCVPRTEHGDPLDHCRARSRCTEHVEPGTIACPRCVGRTRRDLAAILDLAACLPAEAVAQGVTSEAAMLAGPAADPEAWQHRALSAQMGRIDAGYLADCRDEAHPVFVLGTWERMFREDYDQPTTAPATLVNLVGYLDGQLDRLASDAEQDWPLFAAEIAGCRTHLEEVLHDSRRPETGAPCPHCGSGRLVLRYADHDTSGASDRWECWSCGRYWLAAEYRLRIGADYLEAATELSARDMARRFDVSASAVRVWGARGEIRKRGRDSDGITLYDVDDVAKRLGVNSESEPA